MLLVSTCADRLLISNVSFLSSVCLPLSRLQRSGRPSVSLAGKWTVAPGFVIVTVEDVTVSALLVVTLLWD